jgi:hypothetical protein
MNRIIWAKKKTIIALALCAIIAASSIIILQNTRTTEAAPIEPHPGLVGWWRFDEVSGSVADDSSGFGNDGTVNGATWADGKYGKALSFDGNDDYVNTVDSASLDVGGALTISLWMKTTVQQSNKGLVLHDANSYKYMAYLHELSGDLYFFVKTASGQSYARYNGANGEFSTGAWFHIVFTYDKTLSSNRLKIFVNGIQKAQANGFGEDITAGDEGVDIGLYNVNNFFNGIIDEVCIYNRALSVAEIQESFQKSPDFSSKLLAKVPKGTTQVIVTPTWQGLGTINVTIQSPSKNYTEDIVPVYQKTVYSTSDGTASMLNIKRLSISVSALSSDENWYVILEFDDAEDYKITVEIQR